MVLIKARILVKGKVQGVGFRWTVADLARKLGLQGLVRNLRNGQVEIFCEGPIEKIEELLSEIRAQNIGFEGWGVRVDEVSVSKEGESGYRPAWRRYDGFEIDASWYSF
jgi:acylphosphatase